MCLCVPFIQRSLHFLVRVSFSYFWDINSRFIFFQVQLTAESDSVLIDIGPEHLHTLEFILSEYKPFLQSFHSNVENSSEKITTPSADQDQHYRDDLRAGAFQFVDANSVSSREDLPLPYQVVFWNNPPTMAWRYLQPRALTRVDIYPIPFKVGNKNYMSVIIVYNIGKCTRKNRTAYNDLQPH